MPKDIEKVPPTSKVEVAFGIGLTSSEAKLHNQLAPSDQLDNRGSTSVASKPRSTKRRARRTYRYPAGPDDGAARHPKWKRPNALKSGVFSGAPLIPGEDPGEFNKLHDDLIKEWKPSGPTLRFALRRLAVSMWQMHRMEKFTQTKLSLTSFEPQSPTFDENWGFIMFIGYLRSEPEKSFEDQARKYLRPDRINYLREKFPRSNYQSASEWAKAITSEIFSISPPAIPGFEPPEPDAMADFLKEAARQWKTDQSVTGCMVYMREVLEYDSEQTEHLETRIVRQTRYCAELKALEELRSKT